MKHIAREISARNSFTIACHINPDADTLGSAIALAMALESMGKRALVYSRDGVPANYRFLPGYERVTSELPSDAPGTLILLDCNAPNRAALENAEFAYSMVIDHHNTESDFGDIRHIEPTASSTGLLVHRLIAELGARLTTEMATNLYTAMALDTGTFRYSNTDASTLRAASELVEAGADPGYVSNRLYNSWSEGRFGLFKAYISSVEDHGRLRLGRITQQMLAQAGTEMNDTEHFVNYPLLVDSVTVSVLMKEQTAGTWRCSLRSKGAINVAAAAEALGGGGHKNAAGCTALGTFDEVRARLIDLLKNA